MDKTSLLAKKFYQKLGTKKIKTLTNKEKDKAMLNFILKFINKKDSILDLACGYGRLTILLAKKGYSIKGMDISPNLIKDAIEESKKERVKINFKIGDMRNLPYKDETFDKVFCMWSSFNHLLTEKDQLKTLGEIYRILKSKGICVIDIPNGESKWAKEKIKKYGKVIPDEIYGVKLLNYVYNRKILNKLCHKSKFKKYKIKFSNIAHRKRIILLLKK